MAICSDGSTSCKMNPTMNKLYDLIIIGSGPAGLSTALHLDHLAHNLDLTSLILEKSRHPRPKLCAGGILVEGERILAKLGFDLCEVPHVDVTNAYFNYEGRGLKTPFLSKKPIFRVVRRDEFDAWLANKARDKGIEIREEIKVQKVESFDDYALVKTDKGDFRAKVVVGADGSNSIVRRVVEPNPHPHVGRGLEVITPDIAEIPPGKNKQKASFDFLAVPQGISGYVWNFPTQIKGNAMRCWGVYDSNIVKVEKRAPLRQVLAKEMAAHGYDLNEYKLEGYPIRWYEFANQVSIPRVILVGDALGVDALLGEGIGPALGYGAVAATAIQHAFETNDFSFASYHGRLKRSPLGGALKRRTFLAKSFYRLKSARLQRFIWQRFGWLAGLLGVIFVIGWEKKK